MSGFVWGLATGLLSSVCVGTAVGVYAYKRVVRLERRARQAERLAELGLLTGGLAHEIKNPLSTVQLNLQLLQEDIGPEHPGYSRIVNRLGTVKNETSRLRDILDDFLRYAGRLELTRKPTEINALLEELVDFFTPQAQSQKVQLRLRKGDPLTLNIDPRLIKQAVLNLMINATQAMPDGGEVILSCSANGPQARIDVIDTGPGIDPDAAKQIFQAYYSTKRTGTGLGLPMAKRIIEAHDGELTVESEPGKGSDFVIKLPRSR